MNVRVMSPVRLVLYSHACISTYLLKYLPSTWMYHFHVTPSIRVMPKGRVWDLIHTNMAGH